MFYVLFFFVCEFLVFRIYISLVLERKKIWGFCNRKCKWW